MCSGHPSLSMYVFTHHCLSSLWSLLMFVQAGRTCLEACCRKDLPSIWRTPPRKSSSVEVVRGAGHRVRRTVHARLVALSTGTRTPRSRLGADPPGPSREAEQSDYVRRLNPEHTVSQPLPRRRRTPPPCVLCRPRPLNRSTASPHERPHLDVSHPPLNVD
jgi:hypothetical protein